MAYFTAVLTSDDPSGDGTWRAVDVDLEAGSPDELGDVLRGAAEDAGSDGEAVVVAVLEREDEWFALVRSDGDVVVRVFVSDAVAAASSSYAELFAELPPPAARSAAAVADDSPGASGDDPGGDADDDPDAVVVVAEPVPGAAGAALEDVWAGDADLLADLGCSAQVLLRLAASGADPSAATVEIGELLGFADVLESLR